MQTIILEIQESVSEKFLWLLSHFQNSEISVVRNSRIEFLKRLKSSQDDIDKGKIKPFVLPKAN
jgi:hypothetical protein